MTLFPYMFILLDVYEKAGYKLLEIVFRISFMDVVRSSCTHRTIFNVFKFAYYMDMNVLS